MYQDVDRHKRGATLTHGDSRINCGALMAARLRATPPSGWHQSDLRSHSIKENASGRTAPQRYHVQIEEVWSWSCVRVRTLSIFLQSYRSLLEEPCRYKLTILRWHLNSGEFSGSHKTAHLNSSEEPFMMLTASLQSASRCTARDPKEVAEKPQTGSG